MAIPFAESGYRNLPQEVNAVRAAGLWQFVPGTARRYGMRVDDELDDPINDIKSDMSSGILLNAEIERGEDYDEYEAVPIDGKVTVEIEEGDTGKDG